MEGFLEGMHQRVLLGYCADSILNRKNRNTEIEGWFEDNEVLDHLFYDLLLFIMEYSLSENGGCSLRAVSSFLSDDLKRYNKNFDMEQTDRLASYMVRDILQNRGTILSYPLFHHETGHWEEAVVRLIEDYLSSENELQYRLSEQGYDFLLRTREIDTQFEGWVSMLITKQQLERRNYRESYQQARQSLQILRKQQAAFEEFIQAVRRDLRSVENDAYSRMIGSFYENLETEQTMTREIIRLINEYRQEMSAQKDSLLKQEDQKLEESLQYLREMSVILNTIMDTENELLSNRYSVRKIFEQMLEASLVSSISYRRYDFFEEVLAPASGLHDEEMNLFSLLRRPLLVPKADKILNLGLLYAPQRMLEEEDLESEVILREEEEENERLLNKQKRMMMYRRAFAQFIAYASTKDEFRVKEFVQWCDRQSEEAEEDFLSDSKSFYLMFLDLYSLGTIDFDAIASETGQEDEAAEEFDIVQMIRSLDKKPSDWKIKTIRLVTEPGTDYYRLMNEEETFEYGMDAMTVLVERKGKRS